MFSSAPLSATPFSATAGGGATLVNVTGVQSNGVIGQVSFSIGQYVYPVGIVRSVLLDPVGVAAGGDVEPAGFQAEVEIGQEFVVTDFCTAHWRAASASPTISEDAR